MIDAHFKVISCGRIVAETIRSAGRNRDRDDLRVSRDTDDAGGSDIPCAAGPGLRPVVSGELLLLLSVAFAVAPAFARAADDQTVLEEVTVTAQKREESSQEVPIALTAISGESLEYRKIDDLSSLQMQVPGMTFSNTAGSSQQIYIRGIGVDDTTGNIESPIAAYVNGVYQSRTFRTPTLGIDVERVEVLKGPQGTLYGRNATGGAINSILKAPSDHFTGEVQLEAGSFGKFASEGAISGPLIADQLNYRLSYGISRDDGWIINVVNGQAVNPEKVGNARLALSWHPLQNLSVDYDFLYNKENGGPIPITNILMGTPDIQLSGGIPGVLPPDSYLDGNHPWQGKFSYPNRGWKTNDQNSLTIKWDALPWLTAKSITALANHKAGGSQYSGAGIAYPLANFDGRDLDDRFFSEELNLQVTRYVPGLGTEEPFTALLGAYYGDEDYLSGFPAYYLLNNLLVGSATGREKLRTLSFFGDATLPLPWNLSVFGGVRYTDDRKTLNQTVTLQASLAGPPNFGAPYSPPLNIPGTTCTNAQFVDKSTNTSPRFGVGWAPLKSVNFYVKYAEGYNAGGHYYNGCNDGYVPETLKTVEAGMKGRWLDGRLTVDTAAYYNDFKNFQFFQVRSQAGQIGTEVVNVPGARTYGGEIALSALPLDNFQVDVGVSLLHSEYVNFYNINILDKAAGNQNLSGRQLKQAPKATETVGLEYHWHGPWVGLANLGALRLRAEWFHTSTVIYQPFGDTGYAGENGVQDPYSVFNFFASLPTQDQRWVLSAYARNLTKTKYYSYKSAVTWGWAGIGGAPQTFGAQVAYKF